MNTVGIERRWPRARRERPRIEARVVLSAAAVCIVFACAFGVGRVSSPSGAAHAEAATSLTVLPAAAAVPAHLTVVPPLQLGPPPPPPKPKAPARHSSPPPTIQPVAPASAPAPVAPVTAAPPAPAAT